MNIFIFTGYVDTNIKHAKAITTDVVKEDHMMSNIANSICT